MKKFLIAFLLVLGLNPCTSYAFEKTDICFQFDPVVDNEAKQIVSKYLEDETGLDKAEKVKLKKAKRHFFDTLSKSLEEVGVAQINCFELVKVCSFAGWDAGGDKCAGFVGDLQELLKKVAKKYANEKIDDHKKTPVSESTTVKNGDGKITEQSSKKDTDDDPCEKMDLEENGFKRVELKKACCKKMCGKGACSIDNGLIYCAGKPMKIRNEK